MHQPPRRRLFAIATLIGVLAAALVVPTTAAGKTRWVDDDGKAGPTGCGGTAKAARKVADAVVASAAGDTVKVCPGTYTGKVTIRGARDGLKLIAATSTRPVLRKAPTNGGEIVLIDSVDRVTLRGFTVRSNSEDPCGFREGIFLDTAKKAVLSRLRVESTGTTTLSGCQLGIGIGLADSGVTITSVRIVDVVSNAIAADRSAIVASKVIVDYLHAGEPVSFGGRMLSANDGTSGSFTDITINSLASAAATTPLLATGIAVRDADPGFSVADVVISRAIVGVRIESSGTTVAGVSAVGTGTAVQLERGSGIDVSGVTVDDGDSGIFVPGATNSTIHDNDLTGATGVGCEDTTTGSKTLGTANTWTNNTTSTESIPAGLCTEP
jgi:hypothetical protein